MTTTLPNEDPTSSSAPQHGRLGDRTLGVPTILFLAVACTAPLTAIASNLIISVAFGAGVGTLGWLLVIAVLLAAFTVGYVKLSRQVVNAAAYYAYIGHGLGRSAGAAAAFVAATVYTIAALAFTAATGYFSALAFSMYTNLDVAWYYHSAVALGVIALLGRRGIAAAGAFTAVASILQIVLLAVLGVAVLVKTPEQFATAGFSPGAMFSGNWALSLVFVILCFAAYETAAVYGEESREPERTVPRATYGSLVLLTIVFVLGIWSVIAAFPDPVAAAQADPGSMVLRAADSYLGSWAAATIVFSLTFSFWGASTAFHNMASRYMFALGRTGMLPRQLSATHSMYGSPHVASAVQIIISVAVLLPFALAGLDPLVDMFPFVGGINSVGILALMVACSVSVVVASFRSKLVASVWSGRIIPSLAAAGLAFIGGVIVLNFTDVAGSDALLVKLAPLVLVAAGAYGAFAQRRHPDAALDAVADE